MGVFVFDSQAAPTGPIRPFYLLDKAASPLTLNGGVLLLKPEYVCENCVCVWVCVCVCECVCERGGVPPQKARHYWKSCCDFGKAFKQTHLCASVLVDVWVLACLCGPPYPPDTASVCMCVFSERVGVASVGIESQLFPFLALYHRHQVGICPATRGMYNKTSMVWPLNPPITWLREEPKEENMMSWSGNRMCGMTTW